MRAAFVPANVKYVSYGKVTHRYAFAQSAMHARMNLPARKSRTATVVNHTALPVHIIAVNDLHGLAASVGRRDAAHIYDLENRASYARLTNSTQWHCRFCFRNVALSMQACLHLPCSLAHSHKPDLAGGCSSCKHCTIDKLYNHCYQTFTRVPCVSCIFVRSSTA